MKIKIIILKSILNDLLKLFVLIIVMELKTRKYLIYHAVMLTIQDLNEQIKIYENKNHINNIIKKIDLIYQQINSKTEENNTNINDDVYDDMNNNTNNDMNNNRHNDNFLIIMLKNYKKQ